MEATLPDGALHPWRRAALPVAAAVGSVVASIASYLAFVQYVGEYMLVGGWVASSAIDIPASYVVARLIFGRHPAVPFLLLLAISADAIGLAFVAVVQPAGDAHPIIGLGLMAIAAAPSVVSATRSARRRRIPRSCGTSGSSSRAQETSSATSTRAGATAAARPSTRA